jgi:peroxiredoxin
MIDGRDRRTIEDYMADFTLPLVAGDNLSLQAFVAEYTAAVVVFWSGVCSHCRRYDDYLNRLPERYPDIGLLAVASRQNETAQMLRVSISERGLWFPIVHDADRTVAHTWLVPQTPRVFLLDPNCRLLYRGAIDNFKYPQDPEYVAYLDAAIDARFAGQTPPRVETPSFGCPIESVYYVLPKP